MRLLCLEPHVYQDLHFAPGLVYDFDDTMATRLLKDFGPVNSEAVRRGNPAKFAPAPAEMDDPVEEEPEEPVTTVQETPAPVEEKKPRAPRSKQ